MGFLLYSSVDAAEHYKHVDDLIAEAEKFSGKTLRVHGYVQPGSIQESIVGKKTKRTFVLEYRGQQITVRSEGPKPDTFRDQAEVVAKGQLVSEGGALVLNATELSAKCPSKYQGATRTKEYGGAGAAPAGS